MKKPALARKLTLMSALCLVALGAQAQSTVTTYGLLDLSMGSTKDPGGTSTSAVDSGKMTTSFIGFGGSEDLGVGLSAVFKLESFLRADTGDQGRFGGDATWARTASVGLSHKQYGTLSAGRNTTALFVSTLMFNAFGDSFGYSPSIRHYFTKHRTADANSPVTGDTGWSDSLAYSSPTISGFRFGAAMAMKEASNGGNWSMNLGYGSGPLAASVVVQDVKKDGAAAVADTRTVQLSGSYDFGVAKGFLQYGEVKNNTTSNSYDITGIGARVPVGAGAVLVQWGQVAPKVGADRKTLSVGYSHALSKRTDAYVATMSDKIDGVGTGGGYSVGLRHRF